MQCNIEQQSDRRAVTRRVSTHNINLIRTSHSRDPYHFPSPSAVEKRYFFSFIFNCRIESFGFVCSSSPVVNRIRTVTKTAMHVGAM